MGKVEVSALNDPNNVKFVLLDIYSVSNNSWLSFEFISDIAKAMAEQWGCFISEIEECFSKPTTNII